MLKIFKAKNFASWKTTVITIIGGVLMALSVFMPDKFTTENNETILEGFDQILLGVGALITVLTGIFGSKDGDT